MTATAAGQTAGEPVGAVARELLLASRPFSWINTALPFLAAVYGASGRLDAATMVGVLYFLLPYNLLMYGVNDLHDFASDLRNPRKASIEGGLVPPASGRRLWIAVLATNAPGIALIAWLAGPAAGMGVAVAAFTAWAYSAPPLRTKERAGLDSLTSALHFVLPAVCGLLVAGVAVAAMPWAILGAFLAWGVASHALGAVQDICYDREAGIGSIATVLGARRTALVSLAGYGLATGLALTQGVAGLVAAPWLALYLLLPAMLLADRGEAAARRAWRGFLGLNLLVGFVLTQLLLRLWGVTSFTAAELLVGLGLGASAVTLVMAATTWRLVPPGRLADREAGAAGDAVTVVVPARDEAARLPATLAALLAQDGGSPRILVVDDSSTDGTPAIAARILGDRGEVIAAPPLPHGWTGKAWAAWTGVRRATTDLVLLLDADTVVEPGALRALVAEARHTGADLVSGVTRYAMDSRVERLLMPGFALLLFGFLPLGLLARTGGRPARLAFAYGPMMLVRRAAYLAVGGHAAIAASPREDVDLARRFAAAGRRVTLVAAADLGATRHYAGGREIAAAWRRILPAYTGGSVVLGIAALLGFGLAWVLPMALPIAGLVASDPVLLIGGLVALSVMLAARMLIAVTQRMPLATVAWHPVTAPATLALQSAGLLTDLFRPARAWRGRTLPPSPGSPVTQLQASGSVPRTNGRS